MIYPDMPSDVYHGHAAYLSKSMMDLIAKSPLKLRHYLDGNRDEPTKAQRIGTLVHAAALEGADCTNDKEWQNAIGCVEALQRNRLTRNILSEGVPEMSVFGVLDDVPVKCRPDWWRKSAGTVFDLKTTQDASPDGFAKSVSRYRYHVQAAFYTDACQAEGLDVRAFVFVAVETKPPHLIGVYVLDDEAIQRGRRLYQRDLETYRRCVDSGDWGDGGYSDRIEVLSLPGWDKDEI